MNFVQTQQITETILLLLLLLAAKIDIIYVTSYIKIKLETISSLYYSFPEMQINSQFYWKFIYIYGFRLQNIYKLRVDP